MAAPIQFESLSGNTEFKQILKSKKVISNLFTIYYKKIEQELNNNKKIVLSCVSAKKLGNAVKRNKIRRRLKMATRKAIMELNSSFNKKYKYAIFAKAKVYDENFQTLVEELINKFKETNRNKV
jgi:ribonuclease P protein component